MLRLEPKLHALLRQAARSAGISLNEYCSRKLAAPCADPSGPSAMLVTRAASMFGDALVGVVAYGSWARGEATGSSDLDVLVVVSPATALTRDLYRRWDRQPLAWDGHQVEPHFAHLPATEASVAGTWAEVALDGIVLFEREHAVSRRLAAIRRRLASGELTRRSAHGQPYWIEGN